MAAYPRMGVHTADGAVPPLDEDTDGLIDDLSGIHAGIDMIRAGFRHLMLDSLTRDRTQTILATLCGGDGTDVQGLLAAAVTRLTCPDTNPCLRDITPDTLADVRRLGFAAATELDRDAPRDLVGGAVIRIDPYADVLPT